MDGHRAPASVNQPPLHLSVCVVMPGVFVWPVTASVPSWCEFVDPEHSAHRRDVSPKPGSVAVSDFLLEHTDRGALGGLPASSSERPTLS